MTVRMYHSIVKKHPWAEHLKSAKLWGGGGGGGVDTLLSVSAFNYASQEGSAYYQCFVTIKLLLWKTIIVMLEYNH